MSKDMSKKCLSCGGGPLLAKVTITRMVPLADRHGTVKIGGQKIGQVDLKTAWDQIAPGVEQQIRGPAFCPECETEHYYVVGDKKPLRMGSTAEARRQGVEALRT